MDSVRGASTALLSRWAIESAGSRFNAVVEGKCIGWQPIHSNRGGPLYRLAADTVRYIWGGDLPGSGYNPVILGHCIGWQPIHFVSWWAVSRLVANTVRSRWATVSAASRYSAGEVGRCVGCQPIHCGQGGAPYARVLVDSDLYRLAADNTWNGR